MRIILTYCFSVFYILLMNGQVFKMNHDQLSWATGEWEWDKQTEGFSISGAFAPKKKSANGLDNYLISYKMINGGFVPQEYQIPFEFYYKDGDIIIDYVLPKEPNDRRFAVIRVDSVIFDTEFVRPWRMDLYGDIDTVQIGKKQENRQIIWGNAFENYIHKPVGKLRIVLSADRYELPPRLLPLDTKTGKPIKPEFRLKQKWPAYASWAIGGGLALTGYFFLDKSNDIYENDYKTQFFEEAAEPFYQDANKKRHTGIILATTGGAFLANGTILFLSRWAKYQANSRIWDRYYVNVTPQFTPYGDGSLYAGINLNYSF